MTIKVVSNYFKTLFVMSLFLSGLTFGVYAQSIGKPTFQYTGMCASTSFNGFLVDFGIGSIASFGPGNIFHLQISDANGSFATALDVAQSSTITSSPASLNYILPSNFIGSENYKFRVRSTNPVRLSPESDAIYAYYKPFNNTFELNNGALTAFICGSTGALLQVDNPAASFSSLIYRWYKNNVLISGQTTNNYLVTSPGVYFAEINYGTCVISNPFKSQDITVNVSTAGQNVTISSTNGNIVSASSAINLVSTPSVTGFTYQWFLDNILITSATSENYSANLPGVYHLIIDNGTCQVKTNEVTLTLFVPPTTSISAVIPNLISPNNDGNNDFWEIPSIYTTGTNTKILILDSNGKINFNTDNYINNWPQTNIDFDKVNPVFYYIITTATGEEKKGTITIVK